VKILVNLILILSIAILACAENEQEVYMPKNIEECFMEEFREYYTELLEYRKRPEIKMSSLASDYNNCEAFRRIVEKGEVFIPFIIEEIRNGDFFLNQAMAEITGVNITANLEPGEIHGEQGASKLWIDWWEGNKE